jgi:thioredoxin 1
MPVTEITSETQFNQYLNNTSGNKYLFVDFYAQWCGPCKRVAPFIHILSEKYTNVTFLKVDVDECDSLSHKYKVSAMPTFLIFDVGNPKPHEPIVGADTNKIKNALEVLTKDFEPSTNF